MTPDEIGALPTYRAGYDADAEASGLTQATMNAVRTKREEAMEKWKADNPGRYQAALQEQSGQPVVRQNAQNARRGAGGTAGGGTASSINTLLTSGSTQGVDPSSLDLAKSTLLGL
ncbi:hypothetical protein F1536_12485 [Achromobacter xylosoxidans]|uniref:hypothetical protein n=1 Tax=Alcaligenes xylosoxydans xylosoxydans TaxID=85698 RepID=UPI001232B7D0|nr:hypothetical protein [Achromobacter xylosoxidans]KAA5926363.1 hypothetical protein F1536_12485 [Achromobacter xylosoxidans]